MVLVAALLAALDGWRLEAGDAHCNIDRRRALSVEDFLAEYDGMKPVVLVGAAQNWSAMQLWSRDYLVARHGRERVEVVEAERAPAQIREGVHRTALIEDFVAHMDRREAQKQGAVMAFDTEEFYQRTNMSAQTAPKLPHFDHWASTVRYFTWGPAGLGLPFHNHAANWLAMIVGRKSWYIFPPSTPNLQVQDLNLHFNQLVSARGLDLGDSDALATWPHRVLWDGGRNDLLHCVTDAGDVMYLPKSWWHAVINLEESIALPSQEAEDSKWATLSDQYWFRIEKLKRQQRAGDLIDVLLEAVEHFHEPDDFNAFKEFRIMLVKAPSALCRESFCMHSSMISFVRWQSSGRW